MVWRPGLTCMSCDGESFIRKDYRGIGVLWLKRLNGANSAAVATQLMLPSCTAGVLPRGRGATDYRTRVTAGGSSASLTAAAHLPLSRVRGGRTTRSVGGRARRGTSSESRC
jgi:hypothetical protein